MQAEWKSFPGEEDLKTAAKEFSDREYKLERTNKRLWEHQELDRKRRKALDGVRIRVREICGKCYLSPRLDLFTQALFGNCTDIKKFFPSFRLRMASIKIVSGIS